VSLPAFLTRIHNATGPLLGGLAESELGKELEGSSLALEIGPELAADPGQRAGYLLAANLGARLYPRLVLDAPEELAAEAEALARGINEGCEFGRAEGRTLTLSWRGGEASAERITLAAAGWNLGIDGAGPPSGPAAAPAAMAAAALGIGEAFRALFAERLPHGRTRPQPLALNLLTFEEESQEAPLLDTVELGEVHLAGCGAIGQAFAATLRELPVEGRLIAVDHDRIDQGNLQRYLLSGGGDVGAAKPAVIAAALAGSGLEVEQVPSRWGEDPRTAPGRETLVSALDSKRARIELQAGLPHRLFNAWTQPEDLGVSRHLAFGKDPCLACLAWPNRARPSESERIAAALGEHELRVLGYLLAGVPVGQPLLGPIQGSLRLPVPEGAERWSERSLLEDLVERYQLPAEQIAPLAGLPVAALYRDAVCAGMLLSHRSAGDEEISVPLAHQSALAGIVLATWLFADSAPEFRELLPASPQARYDVMRGGSQVWGLLRTREPRCICSDGDFLDAYSTLWG
jgi:hypothetical protein